MTIQHALLALAALAVGCFRSRTVPPIEMYRLLPTAAETSAVTIPPLVDDLPEGSLAIARYITPGLYGQRGIVYRVGEAGYATYPSREWAIPLDVGRRTADLLLETVGGWGALRSADPLLHHRF